MYIEGFVESFANALGHDEYVSKLLDYDLICVNGVKDLVVAALNSPITATFENDQYLGSLSSGEDDCQSDE